jgi:hypothetical protein
MLVNKKTIRILGRAIQPQHFTNGTRGYWEENWRMEQGGGKKNRFYAAKYV